MNQIPPVRKKLRSPLRAPHPALRLLGTLVLALILGGMIVPGSAAAQTVALTSVEAFPNPRTTNDLPPNAIDGNLNTYTWTTREFNFANPAYLAVGFAATPVNRVRLWKSRASGAGGVEDSKNLVLQYTTGTGALSTRTWHNVSDLQSGFNGTEVFRGGVSPDGTVQEDVHDSASGDGYGSLSFRTVTATGIRIGFSNVVFNPTAPNHYRVGELEVWSDTKVEIVDPNPGLLQNGAVVTGSETLATGMAAVRSGAAADGVTQVLLRTTVQGPGSVQVSFDFPARFPEDGGLRAPGGSSDQVAVEVPVVQTSKGFQAFAIYRAPPEFNRPGDEGDEVLGERFFNFRIVYTPAGGSPRVTRIAFKLVRPPLVLVHGLWSDAGTWSFPLVTDSRFSIERADYRSRHAEPLAANASVVSKSIQAAIYKLREERNVAATQADVIGHSMGGLLSRIWVNAAPYKSNENFFSGDVHKLITLDSPHTGSPLASWLAGLRDHPVAGGVARGVAERLKMPIGGALDDLSSGSPALLAIPAAPVPAHALVGVGGSDALTLAPGPLGAFYLAMLFFAPGNTIWQGGQHDFVVGRRSQEGGLPPEATTVVGGLDGIHTRNTASGVYSTRLEELLNTEASADTFAELPAVAGLGEATASEAFAQAGLRNFISAAEGLRITAPAAGAVVLPGTRIQVAVEALPGRSVDRVLLVGPFVAAVDDAPPFLLDLEVPGEAFGDFVLTAIGMNAAGQLFTSPDVRLEVRPTAALQGITVSPDRIVLIGLGDQTSLSVIGHFEDGIDRPVDGGGGLAFETADPQVAIVSPAGEVTATGLGTTMVTVRSGAFERTTAVTVLDGHPVPALATVAPGSVPAGVPGLTLVIRGSGFISGSIVLWNGSPRATTFISAQELTAEIPASDLAHPGEAEIRVLSPSPGGGSSSAFLLPILQQEVPGPLAIPTLAEWGLALLAALLAVGGLLAMRHN